MKTAYVLWWKYLDGSGQGIVRVYTDEVRAQQDYELTGFDDGCKKWELSAVNLFESQS